MEKLYQPAHMTRNTFTANIEVDPSGTFYGWVFKFMGGIQIIAPHECVEEMKRIAHRFL